VVPVTKEELVAENEGIMQYAPAPDIRFHNGRPGDRESLEGLLSAYSELLDDLRKIRPAAHRLGSGSPSVGWIRPRP
jgi:hypothetical protein